MRPLKTGSCESWPAICFLSGHVCNSSICQQVDMSMNALDTFLPAAPRAERRPSEMNPPRHTESGGAAAGSDASTFGAQVSQSAQTTRKAERDAAPKETATSSPEQSAGKAANAQSSPAQTAAKPSQTDQVAATNVNGQTTIAPSTTPQTGNTDTAQPGGSPGDSDANGSSRPDLLTTGSDDTEAVPTPATIKSDNSLSATSPLNSGPAQDQHVPHSNANVSTVQPEKAARAIPQVPDMAEGHSAATQQPSAGGDPKLSAKKGASPDAATTNIAADSEPIGNTANATSASISPTDSTDGVENTVAGATGATVESAATAADKTAQPSFHTAEKPDTATQPGAETDPPAQAAEKSKTVQAAAAGSSGLAGQPGTASSLSDTQLPQAENRLRAEAATPAAAPGNQTAAATAANGASATGTTQPTAGAGTTVQSSGSAPNGTGHQSTEMTASDATIRPSAATRENGTFGDAIKSAELRNDAATTRATGFSASEAGSGLTQTSEVARAATETPQRATTPPPSPPIRDLSMQITRHFEAGTNHFQMRLDPPELGRIDIRMQVTQDGKISLIVAAEHPETIDLLQRDARALERSLQDAGLKTDSQSLSFSLKDSGKSFAGWRGDEDESAAGGNEDGWDIPAESLAVNRRFTDRAVNIQI